MRFLLIVLAMALLPGCEPQNKIYARACRERMIYFREPGSNLCFAACGAGPTFAFSSVPCDRVEALLTRDMPSDN